ncbi:hypothetical protein PAL_GLEAN10024921 [Pteropus alecto]|uniref:Uncharacterized protein n=1 Tax=Pteropus alecto TaxID=9402 RepID=L5KJG4_PTEAL|nr:hypothetical protein PAL_GLEAN10024921 [Pteropus alecto]
MWAACPETSPVDCDASFRTVGEAGSCAPELRHGSMTAQDGAARGWEKGAPGCGSEYPEQQRLPSEAS